MKPFSPQHLLDLLANSGIVTNTWWHDPVFTVEEAEALRSQIAFPVGLHCKNLFLKDKKGALFLLTVDDRARVDMKALQQMLGCARLSFGKPDLLMEKLGVKPGSVTPFAVINDKAGEVQMVLDKALAETPIMFAHPLDNKATTQISGADLERFLLDQGHSPTLLALS
ncbi:MAG: prolyl-tRNA synthetase associated domain-containing protein [Alphaproteobacteria bacterium]